MADEQTPESTEPAAPSTSAEPTPPSLEPPSKDARTMALLAHLLGIILSVIGPLIIWLIKKDEEPFVDDQGKEAMNWQITLLIVYVICTVTACLVFPIFIAMAAWVCAIIFGIVGAVKANDGVQYRYPFALRLIK